MKRALITGITGQDGPCLGSRGELDLTDQAAAQAVFAAEKPGYVFLAAAKEGGMRTVREFRARLAEAQ